MSGDAEEMKTVSSHLMDSAKTEATSAESKGAL